MIARPARAPRALLSTGLLILTLVLLSASISAVAGDLRLLVVCAAGLLSGAALLWPEKVALGLLFVLFTRLSDNYRPAEWALSLNQLAIAACLPAILVRRLLGWQSTLVKDRVLVAMLVYAATISLSSLAAINRGPTIAASGAYLREIVIAFVLINLITTPNGLRRGAWTLVFAGLLVSAAAVLDRATGYEIPGLSSRQFGSLSSSLSGNRLAGPTGDANELAQLLVIVVPLALYLARIERRAGVRLVALGSLLLACTVITQTYSRGGLLGLITVFGVTGVMQGLRLRRLIPLGVALAALTATAPVVYWDRMTEAARFVAAEISQSDEARAARRAGTVRERMQLMQVGALIFIDHPLTGIGKGNFLAAYPTYAPRVSARLPAEPHGPHDVPIHVAAETGLLGLTAFAVTVVLALLGLRDAKQRLARAGGPGEALLAESIEVAMYGFLVTSLFLNDNIYQRWLWLLIALAIIARQLAMKATVASAVVDRPAADPVRA